MDPGETEKTVSSETKLIVVLTGLNQIKGVFPHLVGLIE
jgi:hypothetical protein